MKPSSNELFNRNYKLLLQHLTLKGLQPKTVDAYSRAVRRLGKHFDDQIDDLTKQQLIDYFCAFVESHSWATVRLHHQGIKFYYKHVLEKNWIAPDLVKPPTATHITEIITLEEAAQLFHATNVLSYRVFFFTVYSMGLRLSEGLNLKQADIDASRQRVLIRNAKGNKDRLVPLPQATLDMLRRFYSVHRHPELLFPNRHGGLKGSGSALTPLDKGGLQIAMRKVTAACGLKKNYHPQSSAQLCDPSGRSRC